MLPDHVGARACPSPGQSSQPHSRILEPTRQCEPGSLGSGSLPSAGLLAPVYLLYTQTGMGFLFQFNVTQ